MANAVDCTYVLFILRLSFLFPGLESAPLSLSSKGNVRDGVQIDPDLARTIRETSMLGKTFDFSFCSQDFAVSLGTKRINRKGLRLTPLDAAELAQYLHGETLEDRVQVWCKTAYVSAALSNSTGQKSSSVYTVKELDRYQGDVILTLEQADDFLGTGQGHGLPSLRLRNHISNRHEFAKWKNNTKETAQSRQKRKIISGSIYEWDNQTVPWRFDPKANFDQNARNIIQRGIEEWESNTCFNMPMENNPRGHHIKFVDHNICYSLIGRLKFGSTGQEISLSGACLLNGIVVHEIGHVFGLFHENVRPDRDRYLEILTNNIIPGAASNFLAQSWWFAGTVGVPYDYASVMHYGRTDFSVTSGVDTIRPKQLYLEHTLGQREGLSYYDIMAINFKFCSIRCGDQVLEASLLPKALISPEYEAAGHPANSGCSWLIRAPAGHRVELTFTGTFDMRRPKRGLPCEDAYVEVKYQDVARNGPRFCYDRPNMTLASEHSRMIVRTRVGGTKVRGFSARYRAVLMRCGGCTPYSRVMEPACLATQLLDCSVFNPFRLNRCFQYAPQCCDGYRLDGKVCIRTTSPTTRAKSETTTRTATTETPTRTTTTETPTKTTTTETRTRATTTETPTRTTTTEAPTITTTTEAPTRTTTTQTPTKTTTTETTTRATTTETSTRTTTTETPTRTTTTETPTKTTTTEAPRRLTHFAAHFLNDR